MPNQRFLGTIFISILSGTKILDSYARFRRRRSQISCYRKAVCGADIIKCGGADPCGGKAEPYVNVMITDGGNISWKLARTRTVASTDDPVWNEQLVAVVDVEDGTDTCNNVNGLPPVRPHITFQVMDDDGGGDHYYADDLLGEATLYFDELLQGQSSGRFSKNMKLSLVHPKDLSDQGVIKSSLEILIHWEDMLTTTSSSATAVPGVYFKRCRGNRVRLYHDAHCEPGDFTDIQLSGGPLHGLMYKAENCWEDIYNDISAAKNLILICGWSVNVQLRLIRKGGVNDCYDNCGCMQLGDLLLEKAEQGCTVCVMVWDDVTSVNGFNMAKDGLMGTYDEYTRDFFKDTKVNCVLAKRIAGDDQGIMIGPMFTPLKSSSFTHHQKIVICDTDLKDSTARSLTAYVGGLDLTNGRYDTSRHQLTSTLQCEHVEDFYNGCSAEANPTTGPREPWHDIHSRVEGPGAWDVYQNYVERLNKEDANSWHNVRTCVQNLLNKKLVLGPDDMVVKSSNDTPKFIPVRSNDIGNVGWSVQVLRSIDTENAVFQNAKYKTYFNNPRGLMTDKSIQAAYLYAINRSKRFIYIENQYFLGSSQYWLSHRDAPCPHLVPLAITRRINNAIKNNEDFTAYIMTPLFPEGIPTSGSVQEILQWQYQTMQFMYRSVGENIKRYNRKTKPVDYLQFWFPAVREQACASNTPGSPSTVASPAPADGHATLVANYHKFQIYVHSKMILVDDEWILIGSANINERSMSGGRDSEIAVGLTQDYYTVVTDPQHPNKVVTPKGHIYAFRLQLWQEHFNTLRPEYDDPGSVECARLLYDWTTENLKCLYSEHAQECKPGTTLLPLPYGHACKHPTECDDNGYLLPSEKYPNIINTTAPVVGVRSALLPGPLTT